VTEEATRARSKESTDQVRKLVERAKGVLMMREAGFDAAPDPLVRDKFQELRYLEKSIGKTGLRALHPFVHTSTRDLWQLTVLDGERG